jgi:ubiquitin-protein ligase E3 C
VQYSDFVPCRAGGNASEDALDRLPTSATCMNLLKLPPYRRFVLVVLACLCSLQCEDGIYK